MRKLIIQYLNVITNFLLSVKSCSKHFKLFRRALVKYYIAKKLKYKKAPQFTFKRCKVIIYYLILFAYLIFCY